MSISADHSVYELPFGCGVRRTDDPTRVWRVDEIPAFNDNELCDLDIVTVLNNRGFGFVRGPSCGLETFYPIDEERAKELKSQKDPGSERIEPAEK